MQRRQLRKSYLKKRVFGMPRPLWAVIQCFFIVCGALMTLSLSARCTPTETYIGLILSVALYSWLVFRERIIENIILSFSWLSALAALVCAIAATRQYMMYFSSRLEKLTLTAISSITGGIGYSAITRDLIIYRANIAVTILIGVALWMVAYMFVECLRRHLPPVLRSLSGTEIGFITATLIISLALIIIVGRYTDVFYSPMYDGRTIFYKVVFQNETNALLRSDIFTDINAPQSDMYRPLYGLIAMPAGVIASWSEYLFEGDPRSFAMALNTLHILALSVSLVLFSRLPRLNDADQLSLLLLNFCSFPVLLSVLALERYAFALLWTALYLNTVVPGREDPGDWKHVSFAGAAGASLHSLPLMIFSAVADLKRGALSVLRSGLFYLSMIIVFGQIHFFVALKNAAETLNNFSVYWTDIYYTREYAYQFLRFLQECLLAPATKINVYNTYISYQQAETEGFSKIGCALISLALIGFILNFKEKYSWICLYWLALSYLTLYPVSLGLAGYNDTLAFAVTVSWALFSLIFMGLRKAFSRIFALRAIIAAAAFFFTAAINLRALRELILFGIEYYPH